MTRRTAEERELLATIKAARLAIPDYGRGRPVTSSDVQNIAAVFNLEVFRMRMQAPAQLSSAIGGKYYLGLRDDLSHEVENFIILHEAAHVLRGDVDEPTVMHFTGDYPEFEHSCDTFALLGIMDEIDLEQDVAWVEQRIRDTVPLDNYAWQKYRIPALAPRAIRMRRLVDEWLD